MLITVLFYYLTTQWESPGEDQGCAVRGSNVSSVHHYPEPTRRQTLDVQGFAGNDFTIRAVVGPDAVLLALQSS